MSSLVPYRPRVPAGGARVFLGRGFGFPVAPLAARGFPLVDGPEKVEQSIRIILETEAGERLMRPDFGCGLRRFLMRPNSVELRALLAREVARALARWEPRIELEDVRADAGDDPSVVLVRISYTHVRDRRPGNLVHPFFLEAGS